MSETNLKSDIDQGDTKIPGISEVVKFNIIDKDNIDKTDGNVESVSKLVKFDIQDKIGSLSNDLKKVQRDVEDITRIETLTRRIIAISIITCIGMTLLGSFAYMFTSIFAEQEKTNQDARNDAKELITLLWTGQIGLIGSAMGYYFGSGSKNSSTKSDKW